MLMDYFVTLKYKHADLTMLNKCRVYIQVLSLADITSTDGSQIIPHYKQGIWSQDCRSNYNWPTQQCPGKEASALWRTALQHLEHHNTLKAPLGGWLTSPHQTWHWYMDPLSPSLHHKDGTNQ